MAENHGIVFSTPNKTFSPNIIKNSVTIKPMNVKNNVPKSLIYLPLSSIKNYLK